MLGEEITTAFDACTWVDSLPETPLRAYAVQYLRYLEQQDDALTLTMPDHCGATQSEMSTVWLVLRHYAAAIEAERRDRLWQCKEAESVTITLREPGDFNVIDLRIAVEWINALFEASTEDLPDGAVYARNILERVQRKVKEG